MTDPIGIIASDLTGGMDSAVVFAESATDTTVLLGAEHDSATLNTVLVTDSAAVSPGEAYARVRRAAAHLAGRQLFKKIDSTLRGNVGAELRAVLDESAPARVFVCPALPREGRTVRGGVALLGGVPVHLTSYGSHPATPCRESDVRSVLRDGGIDSFLVGLDDVRQGPDHLRQVIASTDSEAIVIDAESESDLSAIALAFPLGDTRWVACGSSGFAAALAEVSGRHHHRLRRTVASGTRRTMAIIGSRNPRTVAQVEALAADDDCTVAGIDAAALLAADLSLQSGPWVNPAVDALSSGHPPILTTSLSPLIREKRAEVAQRLGELARLTAERVAIDVFILSGGATAWSVCRSLEVSALAVRGELEPGVVTAVALNGAHSGTTFVTKAGGFGNRGTLARLMTLLR